MFRALLIKEWTQMRSLRWVGFLLGVLLPPFVMAMTEAARRGWLPFGSVSSYSVRDLMLSAVPSLTAMLWAFLALLVTSQAFAADRSSGTETFLLERPVPRSRVWRARLLAALGSLIVLVLGHTAVLTGLAQIVSSPGAEEWSALLGILLMGLAGILVAFPAGIAAASLLRSPIQAVLLGLVLAAIPPAIASLLGGMFPLAAFFLVPIGFVLPWLLLLAYPVASYRMACRGEPAGRGRVKRGLWILGTTLAAVPLLFLILAPFSLRAGSGRLSYPFLKIASGGSGTAVGVLNRGWSSNECAWLVDIDSGKRLRFLPRPVLGLAWRDDGELAAVIHESGPLGQRSELTRLDYYDTAGKRVGETIEFDEKIQWVQRLQWHGDYLLAAAAFPKGHYGILIISPGDGTIREVPIEQHVFTWRLVGPTDDGELYVFRVKDPVTAKGEENPAFVLQRLDVERGVLDPAPLFEEAGFPSFAGKWISPSGRYWLRALGKVGQGMRIVEIESDLEFPLDECLRARWVADDRLACLEQQGSGMRLTVGAPGEEREELIGREDTSMIFEVSPDRRHLLVQVWDAPTPVDSQDASDPEEIDLAIVWAADEYWATGGRLREAWLFEGAAGSGTQLDGKLRLPAEMPGTRVAWADADTLALVARSGMGFLDIESDEGARWVFGGP